MFRIFNTHLLTLLSLLLAACAPATPTMSSPAPKSFTFSSGGAYHPQGFGAWTVTLDATGRLVITHQVRDEVTNYGPFTLTEQENSDLWTLIDQANLAHLSSSDRPGMPDEVQYTFTLQSDGQSKTVTIWAGDAQDLAPLAELITRLGAIITNYTGQTPVLR